MTAIDASSTVNSDSSQTKSSGDILGSIAVWITTTEHKRIGRLFMRGGFFWLLGVVGSGVALGIERIDSNSSLFPTNSIVQLFSFFRTGLAIGVLAPLLIGVSIAIVPLKIGAQSISFARMALFGFYSWLIGSAVVIIAIIGNGGPSGGDPQMVDAYLLGVGLILIGLLFAAISVGTTVICARRPGLALSDMSVFSWSVFVGSVGLVLTLPIHLGSVIYLAVDHHYGRLAFGGNYGIDKWLGDAFSQPQTFIYLIPVLGVLAEIASPNESMRDVARMGGFIGVGVLSTAVLGAVTRTPHLFEWSGSFSDKITSAIPYAMFNLLPILGVLIVLAVSLLAIKSESAQMSASLVPALLGVGMIFTGMVGYAIQMIAPANLGGTVFEEGVFVYVGYGAVLVVIGAISHWSSELRGRLLPSEAVIGLGVAGFAATVLASLPYLIVGFADQPANSTSDFQYEGPQALWSICVTVGHVLMALVIIGFSALILKPQSSQARSSS
ncbi:MAG: cbb3-type cytochrome c oxidase subunit I [Ilumatobacteraceae bacterium]